VFAVREHGHVMWRVRLHNGTMVKAAWLSKRMAITGAEVEEKRLEARERKEAA
jgi:hypothetical protein